MPSPYLDHQLITLYKNSVTQRIFGPVLAGESPFETIFHKPINSVDPARDNLMRNAGPAANNMPPVSQKMVQRLTTVIAQAAFGNGSTREDLFRDVTIRGHRHAGIMTIGQFMALSAADQLATIDQAWMKVCTKKSYNKLSSEMYEPTAAVVEEQGTPVPSGAIPGPGNSMTVGYFNEGRVPDAFKGLGVGFRVDGSGANTAGSIQRVLRDGMTTQLKNRPLMYDTKGWEVEGTTVDLDTNAPRVWSTKNDLFNESAVCVARNLYGATAFPTREMTDTEAVLWAVDVRGLIGFDTETYQTTLGANRQWRPGEKAYKKIPVSRLIGYTRFDKTGAPPEGGWRFRIPAPAAWTFIGDWNRPAQMNPGSREARVVAYVNAQLAAWAGPERTISGAYDFA
jgi:hypothetical protein